MFEPFSPETICWMCLEAPADSRDHKFKRTDVVDIAGRDTFLGKRETVVRSNEGAEARIQGPRSFELKFKRTMCAACNGTKSQPDDLAYAEFASHVSAHEQQILETRKIDQREIFGGDWRAKGENVARGIAKHAGGRLADWLLLVPDDVRKFLNGESFPSDLGISLEIRTDIARTAKWARDRGLIDGTLWVSRLPREWTDSNGELATIAGFLGFRWLRIYWVLGSGARANNPFAESVIDLLAGSNTPDGQLSVYEGSEW